MKYGPSPGTAIDEEDMTSAEKKKHEEQQREWRAEMDLNTLIDAEKIKNDKDRMAGVMKRKKALMAALKST